MTSRLMRIFRAEVAELRKQALFLSEVEKLFYFQQAKSSFLKNSDRCLKYFHTMVKRNSKRNHIVVVCKEDVSITTFKQHVAN